MRIVIPKVLIELSPSSIAGVGVFAATAMRDGQRIAGGIGDQDYRRLISWTHLSEFDVDVRAKIDAFCIGTPEGFIPPDHLDFNRLSIEWYLNHSCEGNVGFNDDGDFVVRRRVAKGDELTYDYGLAESNPRFRMVCACGSSNCRGLVTGNDWKDPVFREQNLNYMLPRLRRTVDVRVATPTRPRKVASGRH